MKIVINSNRTRFAEPTDNFYGNFEMKGSILNSEGLCSAEWTVKGFQNYDDGELIIRSLSKGSFGGNLLPPLKYEVEPNEKEMRFIKREFNRAGIEL